jgi:hypothetical protein
LHYKIKCSFLNIKPSENATADVQEPQKDLKQSKDEEEETDTETQKICTSSMGLSTRYV